MKTYIFCGYHNTGKTTFIKRLAENLIQRGYSVSYIKHMANPQKWENKDLNEKDTEQLIETGIQRVVSILPNQNITYTKNRWKPKESTPLTNPKEERKILRSTLREIHSDYVLIEGFKHYDGPIPKIIFAKSSEELTKLYKEIGEFGIYLGYTGYNLGKTTISTNGINDPTYIDYENPDISLFTDSKLQYPMDIDCGECGVSTCKEFALGVLHGKKTMRDCKPLNNDIKLLINNQPIYMKSFVANTLKDIIKAYVQNLHEAPKGEIKITIKE